MSRNLGMAPRRLRLAVAVGLLWPLASIAQVNMDAFRDYFLVGQFGEVCTMCEVVVFCEAGDSEPAYESIPASGTFTVYDLQTRTFWSQVSTIWEWFIANFTSESLAARGHTRPVYVYDVVDGNWSERKVIEGRLILEPGIIEFGDHHIDRVDRSWIDVASGEKEGYCQRMPLWESLDIIEARTGGGQS